MTLYSAPVNWDQNSAPDIFDLGIGPLGFERRCVHAAETFSKRISTGIALAFPDRQKTSYKTNKDIYNKLGFKEIPYDTNASNVQPIVKAIGAVNLEKSPSTPNILVDISSMSRPMMAEVLLALEEASKNVLLNVYFSYSPAEFFDASLSDGPVTIKKPVIPQMAGWSPGMGPLHAILGLGYEVSHAVGTIEELEASSVCIFKGKSIDQRYDDKIEELLEKHGPSLRLRASFREYSLARPSTLFYEMESLVSGIVNSGGRVVVVPFGPKIFSIVAMIVSRIYYPKIMVKRISGETHSEPHEKLPSGEISGFKLSLSNS